MKKATLQCLDSAHSPLILISFTIAEILERKTYLDIKGACQANKFERTMAIHSS